MLASRLHSFLKRMWQTRHEYAHETAMKSVLRQHSSPLAHTPQSSWSSWHASDSHSMHAARHSCRMKPGFDSHSPLFAHRAHSSLESTHAAYRIARSLSA